ncbi:MAG: hypothetical protein H8D45_02525, partial [Bacteroidetes bacterium]|nr:hypothetical protein [Bacteroidota bacterium]
MKKVLMITNAFPPYKYVGRHRIIQFAKYLPEYNWEPIIVTPTTSYLWEKDIGTYKEIPESLEVYRFFMPLTLPVLVKRIFGSGKKDQNSKTKNPVNETSSNIQKITLKLYIIKIINSIHKFLIKFFYL